MPTLTRCSDVPACAASRALHDRSDHVDAGADTNGNVDGDPDAEGDPDADADAGDNANVDAGADGDTGFAGDAGGGTAAAVVEATGLRAWCDAATVKQQTAMKKSDPTKEYTSAVNGYCA
jgi:hypothetical protein